MILASAVHREIPRAGKTTASSGRQYILHENSGRARMKLLLTSNNAVHHDMRNRRGALSKKMTTNQEFARADLSQARA
jgi:hypothetical protein